jgi:hypothetical protein
MNSDPHLWRALSARISKAIYHLDKGDTEAARTLLAQLEAILPGPAPHNVKAAFGK